jgi:hypothetical protein
MADPNNGTVHVMEEEMRDAGIGVFEKTRKAEKAAPANKMDASPANKSTTTRKRKGR